MEWVWVQAEASELGQKIQTKGILDQLALKCLFPEVLASTY